jgi:transcriptional regulator with XRE-family HTH domain
MKDTEFKKLCLHFASEIKSARLKARISQEALALAAEVDRTYVSQLERGIANPSLMILCRLAGALNLQLQIRLLPDQSEITMQSTGNAVI